MAVNQERLRKFIQIYKEEFEQEITEDEARAMTTEQGTGIEPSGDRLVQIRYQPCR